MLRHVLSLVALSLVFSPVACKKKQDDEGKTKSASKKDDDGEPTEKTKKKAKADDSEEESDEPKGKAIKGCKAPEDHIVKADWTIPEGCKLKVKDSITIEEGATLTIEPGAKLSFNADTYLWIKYGRIVAKGTEESPIVFTSSNTSPAAGDWQGLIFDEKLSSGSVLDHVTVEYAGHSGGYAHAAITIYGAMNPGRLTITNATIQHNEQGGIFNEHEKSKFAKVEGNTFAENAGASMHLHPDVIGSIGSNKLSEPIKVKHGDVTSSQTWPKAPSYHFEDNVSIKGKGQAAIVTFPAKAVLKFAGDKYLWIGGGDGGGIVAKGVTFTSANASAAEGDWQGLIIDQKAVSTTIEDCVIEYAGKGGGYGRAAVTYYEESPAKVKGVKIKNCAFRHNEHGAIYPNGEKDCGALATDNKSEGQPVCVTKE